MMCLSRSFLAVAFTFGVAAPMQAQWQQISTIPDAVGIIKFFSPSLGFAGTGAGPGGPVRGSLGIYRTTDGGFSWQASAVPSRSTGGEVTDILMIDSLQGWASIVRDASGLWSTIDGGLSWQRTTLQATGTTSVSLTPRALIVTDLFGNTQISTDSGKTWQSTPNSFQNDAAFFNNNNGVSCTYRGANWCITQDGGLTWQPILDKVESWSIYTLWASAMGFAAPEGNSAVPPVNSPVIRTTDFGNTWRMINTLPFTTTGHLTGWKDKMLFVQEASNSNTRSTTRYGVEMSTDQGVTWQDINGPRALNDTRFCIIQSCGIVYLYAFDEPFPFHGSTTIWRHPFPVPIDQFGRPVLSRTGITTSSRICGSANDRLIIASQPCTEYQLESVRFSDSSLVLEGALGFMTVPKLPKFFVNGSLDSLSYFWRPKPIAGKRAIFFDTIVLHYVNPLSGAAYDTAIALTLNAVPDTTTPQLSPYHLEYPLTSTCSFADSLLLVFNLGCDTMTVDSLVHGNSRFTILGYDSVIAPGTYGTIYLRYKPRAEERTFDDLRLYVTEQGVQTTISLPITGNGEQGLGILSLAATSLDAGSISFCVGDTALSSPFYNVGCDTLVISNIRFTSDGAFTLTSQPKDSLVAPNGGDLFSFLFAPRLKDQHRATLTFHSRNLHGTDRGHDTSIELRGFGLGGTKVLAEAPAAVDFGWIYQCQSRDTIVTLYNRGCDTLYVTDGSFSNPSFTSGMTYPHLIAPGDSLVVDVHVDTSLSNGSSTIAGEFIATSKDADNTIAPIPLRVIVIPPVHLVLQILKPDSAYAGDKVTYVIRLVGPHSPSLFSAFHFDLIHNDDLLSFVNLSGPGLAVVSDPPDSGIMIQHFTLAPATLPDTIGWLTFKAYLSKESTTSLSIAKFDALNVIGVSEDCIVTLADSGSRFTYRERCGEDLMRSVLEGKRFFFDRIVPNPARNTISVVVKQFVDGPLAYELSDELGRTVLQGTDIRDTSLTVQDILSGIYYLRLRQDDVVATQRVLIQH